MKTFLPPSLVQNSKTLGSLILEIVIVEGAAVSFLIDPPFTTNVIVLGVPSAVSSNLILPSFPDSGKPPKVN